MLKVGIPRGLLYYQFYPMWRTFFHHLGAEVVVSPPTNRGMVAQGAARMVAETCLPVKVFCGHVLALEGKCDYLFIPGIRAIQQGAYNCSKFLGLPDMVRAAVPEAPPIIDVDIDLGKGQKAFSLAVYSIGRRFTWNPLKVREAARAAWAAHLSYLELMHQGGLTPPQALARLYGEAAQEAEGRLLTPPAEAEGIMPLRPVGGVLPNDLQAEAGPHVTTIAVIGHPYTLYDDYITHRLLHRLRSLGAKVVTSEMVSQEALAREVARLAGRPYWTFEDEVVGAGGHYLDSSVDGVISVAPFGCGPDSLMLDIVQRYARHEAAKPFMALTIDEHTAEAGLVTRLEAFLDLLLRRRKAAGISAN